MAGKYNKWVRAKLAARIESNGGYHAQSGSFALSWTVHFYGTISTAEQARKALVDCDHFLNEADLMLRHPDFDEWFDGLADHERCMYEYAQSTLVDDLSSDEGFAMWRPETAKRYGFDYDGPGATTAFDMGLGNYGRGGKHVCLTHFEGQDLQMYNRDLSELVEQGLDGCTVSNKWCRQLMGIMDELDESLTDENAARAGQYYESDWLMGVLVDLEEL